MAELLNVGQYSVDAAYDQDIDTYIAELQEQVKKLREQYPNHIIKMEFDYDGVNLVLYREETEEETKRREEYDALLEERRQLQDKIHELNAKMNQYD